MEKRNRYTAEFKTKVVLEVLRKEQTVNEIASKYELSPVMIRNRPKNRQIRLES
jgi:transposase-like protein